MTTLYPTDGSHRACVGTSGKDTIHRVALQIGAVRHRPPLEARMRPCRVAAPWVAQVSHRWTVRCGAAADEGRESGMSEEEVAAVAEDPGNAEEGYRVHARVYNLDRYGLAPMGAKLLKKDVDGIYHVAVAVHNCEFWYDHKVNQQDLAEVEFAFGFGPSFVYDLGRTRLTKEEIERHAFGVMQEKYHIDSYDCFHNNCHHFANDLCMHLNGRRIPQWCIDHGEQGLSELSESSAAVTRFVTNKIARIMMVSWGKYSKERFVTLTEVKEDEEGDEGRAVGPATVT